MQHKWNELNYIKQKMARIELGIKNEEKWMAQGKYDEEEIRATKHHLDMDKQDLKSYQSRMDQLKKDLGI